MRDGKPVPLPPKAQTILCILVENHGKLVEREELMQRVWPNVFVEDGNLTVNVFALRKALAEGVDGVSPIETIPKRGYRFTAPVATLNAPTAESERADPVPGSAGDQEMSGPPGGMPVEPGHSSAITWAGTGVAGVLIFLAAGLLLHFGQSPAQGSSPRASLAVMPFQNLTGQTTNDYLSDSLTEELITRFARDYGGDLRVIARESTRFYAARKYTLPQIATELRVQYVIQGSVRSEGNHIRVAAELVRAADQTRLWADSFDGDASQLLEFEDTVAESVAHGLSLRLLPGRGRHYAPSAYAAHDDYLRGLYFLSRRSKPDLEKAIENFAAATASDPHYARAYAELAVTYNLMGGYSWVSPGCAHSLGKAAAEQAVTADPSLGEAHAALGYSEWFYEWNPAAAERELRLAIRLDPNNIDAHHWYSQVLMTSGRFSEAEQQMQTALALDPKSPILRTNRGWLHYFERRYPKAIDEMENVVRDDPDFVTAHYKLWEVYSVSGDMAGAWRECQRIAHLLCSPENEKKISVAYQQGGYPSALKSFVNVSPEDYVGSYVDGSRCLIFAGNKSLAMDFLERAYRQKDGWIVFVPIDPAFDSLRTDPRFAQFRLVAPPVQGQRN